MTQVNPNAGNVKCPRHGEHGNTADGQCWYCVTEGTLPPPVEEPVEEPEQEGEGEDSGTEEEGGEEEEEEEEVHHGPSVRSRRKNRAKKR